MYYAGYLGYFQLNIEYLIDTYCVNKDKPELACNGKCHLSQKLTNATNENASKSSSINNIVECFFPVFNPNQNEHIYSFLEEVNYSNNKIFYPSSRYSYLFHFEHFRPPTV